MKPSASPRHHLKNRSSASTPFFDESLSMLYPLFLIDMVSNERYPWRTKGEYRNVFPSAASLARKASFGWNRTSGIGGGDDPGRARRRIFHASGEVVAQSLREQTPVAVYLDHQSLPGMRIRLPLLLRPLHA